MPRHHPPPILPSTSNEPPPSVYDLPNIVPPGFTFQNYVDGSPPVNGHLMAIFTGWGKHVYLPCQVLSFNRETKTAIVKATDGVQITVININVPIENSCISIWGLPTAATVLSAEEIEPLPDDHDFERAQWFIEYLLRPSTWGAVPPTQVGQIS